MKKFEPTFESLRTFECPKWFKDAKFGIWSHWGPQSVPMYGDWYARAMYIEGSDAYKYHLRHYGHPSEFGYKDLCELWKAEKFDPDALMDLYVRAGAKYFVAQAMHHDNFFNYDSKVNKFNSVNVGPKRDICMEWKNAARKYGLPFGLTEHLAASFSWFSVNKGADKKGPYAGVPYDGNNPECPFYYNNREHYVENLVDKYAVVPWYTQNEDFHRYWLDSMKELIDRFEPDLLYSDGALPFHVYYGAERTDDSNPYAEGLEAVSYLYNKSIEKYGENRAVYNQKERAREIYSVGILDIEKSQLSDISSDVWQTDTCIGNWFYDVRQDYKTPAHIIEMLVDIISKNGVMLLNILQRPDGSIDREAVYILEELEKWFKICAEAVYETEPWRVAAEGDSAVIINRFQEDQVSWKDSDFRFVKKNNFVYAYVMAVPESRVAVIKSFNENETVKSVTLLGYGKVEFSQAFGVLTVKLPTEMPTNYTNCLKIEL